MHGEKKRGIRHVYLRVGVSTILHYSIMDYASAHSRVGMEIIHGLELQNRIQDMNLVIIFANLKNIISIEMCL